MLNFTNIFNISFMYAFTVCIFFSFIYLLFRISTFICISYKYVLYYRLYFSNLICLYILLFYQNIFIVNKCLISFSCDTIAMDSCTLLYMFLAAWLMPLASQYLFLYNVQANLFRLTC